MHRLHQLEEETTCYDSPRLLPNELQMKPEIQTKVSESLNGKYDLGFEIGRGASGKVVLAEHQETGKYVAIKIINKLDLQPEQLIRVRREYSIMKQIKHKNWVQLLEVVENPEQICLVMEYASCGDLYTHIVSSPNMKLSEKEARVIFSELAEGLLYLHDCGFIHRDLKPENILLGKKGEVLITDLGFGTMWDENTLSNTPCGSLYYASPEIIAPDGVYRGPEVDVWSLGVVLYVMTCGKLPFRGTSANSTRDQILSGDFIFPVHITSDLKNLISGMLSLDPKTRFTMEQVIAHDWITGGKPKQTGKSVKRILTRRRSFGASLTSLANGLLAWGSSGNNKTPIVVEELGTVTKDSKEKVKKERKVRNRRSSNIQVNFPKKEKKKKGRKVELEEILEED